MAKIVAKRVSNYELFYDLVFVLAVSRLVSFLHTDTFQLPKMIAFIVSTGLLMSIWMYQTIYYNKYGERDRLDVYLNIPAMFIVGNFGLMLGLSHYSPREFILYNGLLIISHVFILFQYYLRGRHIGFNEDMLATMKRLGLAIAYFSFLVLLVLGLHLFDTNDYRFFLLWLVPWILPISFRKTIDIERINFPHMVERLQLITIITFGETVVGLIQSFPLYKMPLLGIFFFIGISFMFVSYISQTYLTINHHQKTRGLILIYSHLLLFIAIGLVTVGIEILAHPNHTTYGVGLLTVGVFIYYLSLYSTSVYNRRLFRFAKSNYAPYMLLVIIGDVLMWGLKDFRLGVAIVFAVISFMIPRLNFRSRRRAREQADGD